MYIFMYYNVIYIYSMCEYVCINMYEYINISCAFTCVHLYTVSVFCLFVLYFARFLPYILFYLNVTSQRKQNKMIHLKSNNNRIPKGGW